MNRHASQSRISFAASMMMMAQLVEEIPNHVPMLRLRSIVISTSDRRRQVFVRHHLSFLEEMTLHDRRKQRTVGVADVDRSFHRQPESHRLVGRRLLVEHDLYR